MSFHEQAHVIVRSLRRHHPPAVLPGLRADHRTSVRDSASHNRVSVLRALHHLIPEITDATCGNLHLPGHAGDDTHRLRQTTRFPRRPKTAVPCRGA